MLLAEGLRRGGIRELRGEYFVPILIAYEFRMVVMHLVDDQIAYLKSGQIIMSSNIMSIFLYKNNFFSETPHICTFNCNKRTERK